MDGDPKVHCWECRRRCLVCDFTAPACKRCIRSGVACPGYGKTKPRRLKWLAIGESSSRQKSAAIRGASRLDRGSKTRSSPPSEAARPAIGSLFFADPGMIDPGLALAQCAEYFNTCIYADIAPLHSLGHNPHVYQVTKAQIRAGYSSPLFLQSGMICIALSHRINRTKHQGKASPLTQKFYQYWGFAIRHLNEHLTMLDSQDGMAIAGIATILLADIQHGSSLGWRCHMEGVNRLMSLRGGLHNVSPSDRAFPSLQLLWYLAVIGNTTCSTSDLVQTDTHLVELQSVLGQCSTAPLPFQMCPPPLFVEIVLINHLRFRATKAMSAVTYAQEAQIILARITSFSATEWVKSKTSSVENWLLAADVFKMAVSLYCLLSMESLSVLAITPSLSTISTSNASLLQEFVERALQSPRTKRFMVWPLVVLGVDAARRTAARRTFVTRKLEALSYELGTSISSTAKDVLEKFWKSDERSWDACFDRPYAFTTQIAPDTGRLLEATAYKM